MLLFTALQQNVFGFDLQELIRGYPPSNKAFFQVEKILAKKKEKGETFYLLKYLNYKNKENVANSNKTSLIMS